MRETKKKSRRSRPALEGLEDRKLLNAKTHLRNGTAINDKDLRRLEVQLANLNANGSRILPSDRRISYTTPQGAQVTVTLYGKGTLKGTTVSPDGSLNLVYDLTDKSSRILALVHGGNRMATVNSIRDASQPLGSSASTGVDPINAVVMPNFVLADGGFINLTGGVLTLQMQAIGRNTSIYLKEGQPPPVQAQTTSVIATGGASIGGVTPVQTVTQTTVPTVTGPTGIEIRINQVNAGPLQSPPFGNPQVFSIDTTTKQLIRFDTVTGDPTLAVPLPSLTSASPSVGLAQDGQQLVVLVGDGTNVSAFNAVTGAAVGQFTVSNLGLTSVDGIGSSASRTVISENGGPVDQIDVSASLASGQAVKIDGSFVPTREFTLDGGATGLPGSDVIYVSGAGHFDPNQPNLNQFGMMTLTPSGAGFKESSRTAIPGIGTPYINAGPTGMLLPSPFGGLGSVDSELAQITGQAGGKNIVTYYNPSTLAITGTTRLNDANPLVGLSESFHPELLDAALIDISGNLKRFVGTQATGLILNDRGLTNLVAIHRATDTAVIGRPLNHVAIPIRHNVQLISTARGQTGMGDRGGVTIDKNLTPTGPLFLPGTSTT